MALNRYPVRGDPSLGRKLSSLWLSVFLALGVGTPGDLLAATLHVDPVNGLDTNAGDAAHPWKTIGRALGPSGAASGDTVNLAPGTYGDASGETFPLALKDGVALVGAGAATTTILLPDGGSEVFLNDGTALATLTSLTGVTLAAAGSSFPTGLTFVPDGVTQSPRISGVTFDATLGTGIYVDDGSGGNGGTFDGLLEGNTFSTQYEGVLLSQSDAGADLSPTIKDSGFGNQGPGITMYQYGSATGKMSPTITGSTFTNAARGIGYGFSTYSSTLDGTLEFSPTIRGNTFSNQSSDCIGMSVSSAWMTATSRQTFAPTITGNTFTPTGVWQYGVALSLPNFGSGGTLAVKPQVTGNSFSNLGAGVALWLWGAQAGSGATLDGAITITSNTITSSAIGIAVSGSSNSSYAGGGKLDVVVAGNTVADTQPVENPPYGIRVSILDQGSAGLAQSVLVQGNKVTNTDGTGIQVQLVNEPDLASSDVQVTDNVVTGSAQDGIELVSAVHPYDPGPIRPLAAGPAFPPWLVSCNTVTGNGRDTFVTGVYAGIRVARRGEGPDPLDLLPDLGGGGRSTGGNDVSDNRVQMEGLRGYNVANEIEATLSAQGNYWGTPPDQTVDGLVDTTNSLESPPAHTFAATLTAEPSVTVGQAIHYVATLTAASCGQAVVTFQVPVPPGTTLVPGSVETSQGTVLAGSSARVGRRPLNGAPAAVQVAVGVVQATAPVTISWAVTTSAVGPVSSQGTISSSPTGTTMTDDSRTPSSPDATITQVLAPAVPGTVQFSPAAYQVLESAGTVVLTVTRTGGADGAVSVTWTTADGTARSGQEFTGGTSTVSWADQDSSPKTITIPITHKIDTVPTRTFTVVLSNATGGATVGQPDTAAVTIQYPASQNIPTAGPAGLAGLAGLLALAGLVLVRRRAARTAALLLLGIALSTSALAGGKSGERSVAGSVRAVEAHGTTVTLRLADGHTFDAPTGAFVVKDRRGRDERPRGHRPLLDIAHLPAGAAILVHAGGDAGGEKPWRVRVVVFDSLEEATAARDARGGRKAADR